MENTIKRSKALFDEGFGCAEAVLMAITKHNNIQSELIPRIASGLKVGKFFKLFPVFPLFVLILNFIGQGMQMQLFCY